MNNDRRKSLLTKVLPLISEARCLLEDIAAEENEALDNLPDGLRESERGERMEEIASAMDDAVSALEDVESALQECTE